MCFSLSKKYSKKAYPKICGTVLISKSTYSLNLLGFTLEKK
jgi:hypothetical protein